MVGTYQGIISRSSDSEVIVCPLGAADGIILNLDEGTDMGSSDGPFDGSIEVKPEGSLLRS